MDEQHNTKSSQSEGYQGRGGVVKKDKMMITATIITILGALSRAC